MGWSRGRAELARRSHGFGRFPNFASSCPPPTGVWVGQEEGFLSDGRRPHAPRDARGRSGAFLADGNAESGRFRPFGHPRKP